MAGTGKGPGKGPKREKAAPREEAPAEESPAEAEAEAEAGEPEKPSRPLRAAPVVAKEGIPAGGWVLLGLSVTLFAVAGVMFFLPIEAASPEVWMIVGAVCAIGGFAALAYFFDKWGKL